MRSVLLSLRAPDSAGVGTTPLAYLGPGDIVEMGIENLGVQQQVALPVFQNK